MSWPPPPGLNQSGAHIAERMPEDRMLCSARKRASSMTLGRRSDTRSSMTRRAIERLTRPRASPFRLREAFTCRAGGVPPRSRMAPRSAGTASKSRLRILSNSSFSGRCSTSSLTALLRVASTRFCRCSSAGSMAGLVLMSLSSRTEKTRVPSGSSDVLLALLRAEGQAVLAERDHVALPEPALVLDGQAVQERPVLALEVEHVEPVRLLEDLRVVAGQPLVGKEDVALPGASDRDPALDEREALLGPVCGLDRDLRHGDPGSLASGRGPLSERPSSQNFIPWTWLRNPEA